MSSIAYPEPEMPAAEDLVAYLDGELPPDDCRRVEQRLATDANFRQQLRDLDQAWEALDTLPSTRADDDFARTTMELATIEAQRELSAQTATATEVSRRRLRSWAAAGVAAAIVGFVAAWMLIPDGNQKLLDDLSVIRQVDLLRPIPDVDFLRRLATDVSPEKLAHDDDAVRDEFARIQAIAGGSPQARREWIEKLTAEQKATLAVQAKRFGDLPPDEKQRLQRLDREIRSAQDAERLQKTLISYGQWHARLSPGEQEQLRADLVEADISAKEQVDRVEQLVRRESAQASRRLSAEDTENLRSEVFAIAQEWREQFSRRRRERGGGDWAQRLEGPRGALMILSWQLGDDERRSQIRERLVNRLSPDARERLDRLDHRGRWQLHQWIRDSLELKPGPDELEQFFADKLDYDERERLLSLSADEMQTHLERMYYAAQLGFPDSDRGWKEFREATGWDPTGQRRPDRLPDGPPRGYDRPGPPRHDFHERARFDREPNGPPGPRPGGPRIDGRPPHRPGPPRNGPGAPGQPEEI
jgi:hypothetical protein